MRVVGVVEDISLQRRADEALRESEKRFRQFADNSQDVLWIMNVATERLEYISPAHERLYGESREPLLSGEKSYLDLLHPDDRSAVQEAIERVLKVGSATLEERLVKPDGTILWIHNSGFAMPDDDGVVRRIGGIAEDVTERRAAEERLKLLAAEVDHRAKNMLAVVQVMLRQTRGATVAEYAKAAQGRIAALARAHTLLSKSHWRGADLGRLLAEELAPFRRAESERISIDGPPVLLRPEAAQSITMALHELATNAVKYGALSVTSGRIAVAWSRDATGDLVLHWAESGGPPVVAPSRKGLGTSVIERSIGQQLGGSVRFDWKPAGLACQIRVPAKELAGVTA
jgi:PAS domain S-box-containing protein